MRAWAGFQGSGCVQADGDGDCVWIVYGWYDVCCSILIHAVMMKNE